MYETNQDTSESLQSTVDTAVDGTDEDKAKEYAAVKKAQSEYDQARTFDKHARRQYAVDRRYSAGTANANWAVSTNLIGSFIDILTSFLYARNPDVSVKKAAQVNNSGTASLEDFAKTMEIVISKLWKQGRLKENARRMVRSGLSTGVGWIKVILVSEGTNIPQMEADLNDVRDNIARLEALKTELQIMPEPVEPIPGMGTLLDGVTNVPMWPADLETIDAEIVTGGKPSKCQLSPDEFDAKMAEFADLQASLEHKVEVATRKYLAIDFIPADCIQVSLDVRYISDYRNAGWISNDIYRTVDEAKALFPKLTEEQLRSARKYYQKRTNTSVAVDPANIFSFDNQDITEADADQFTAGVDNSSQNADGDSGLAFVKVTERWDHRTNHVYTMIDGVKCWAVEPYQPDYPASRFYPYFAISFYEVDGERHPQSLAWRLHKLQDEYSASRSSFRLMRQRATPGVIFNATGLSDEDMERIKSGAEQEFIGIKPTNPDMPIQNWFAPKPYERVDPRMYDNTPILADMEKIAGVQEALQSSSSPEKTATEAEIQQTGFASRTTADRDVIEEMLTELANYTGQLAIGGIPTKDVQRMAGPAAFWPEGMALDDLLTMVELDVVAGTTGKPRAIGDRDAWGVLLPQLKEAVVQYQQALMSGNVPLAESIKELVRETMIRMGDDTDIDRFLPEAPPTAGVPQIDPATGQPIPPGVAGPAAPVPGSEAMPPVDPAASGGAPNPAELANPELVNPELVAPV